MEFVPSEKGVPIRQPSTANLQLDSMDRDEDRFPKPWSFQIARNSSILNGYFTRIGTTEVVLEWSQPNIVTGVNDTIAVDISGVATTVVITIDQSIYTVEQLLDEIVKMLNLQTAPTNIFSIQQTSFGTLLDLSGGVFTFDVSTPLRQALFTQLGFSNDDPESPFGDSEFWIVVNPDIRPWRYLDFLSAELTYNQDIKDASTCPIVRDVLCRWYFDWDTPSERDSYGFPILMGYTPFKARRLFNPPKQIRWDARQPIGNLSFQVYGQNRLYDTGVALADFYRNPLDSTRSEWLMTLQISEV